jgi:hypothetical protein
MNMLSGKSQGATRKPPPDYQQHTNAASTAPGIIITPTGTANPNGLVTPSNRNAQHRNGHYNGRISK